ncbi:4-hydroxyphenylpyruvate dioxygenase [Streptomyces sp. Edi2]|uniref:4-hydroxyphenylpyruvate dioxygenase n=1 Tax=Streptomyces sp. Edi2 TaxID=3162528 RepID=UPI003305F59F
MPVLKDLSVDHVRFAVVDLDTATDVWVKRYGMSVYARSADSASSAGVATAAVGTAEIRLVLTAADGADHPAAAYVALHGDGVSDIALRTSDAAAAFRTAVRRGAQPVSPPADHDGIICATISGFGDVVHTFVERPNALDSRTLPGLVPSGEPVKPGADNHLDTVDHFAVCVEAGQLRPTVDYYKQVLDFREVFTERIIVGEQAMDSIAIQSRSGEVTFTVIEPDLTRQPGQIDAFIKNHGGAGVQHIAFSTRDITRDVERLRDTGVRFLETPGSYYDMLPERLTPTRHGVEQLRALDILADEDPDGQLLQIFTGSVHPRNTLFFELVERLGSRTFGSANIKALYTAVERQRAADDDRR